MPTGQRTGLDTLERTHSSRIEQAANALHADAPLVLDMLEAFPTAAVLLDGSRQIVALNSRALQMFDLDSPADARGSRLGESLGCLQAGLTDGGCGTAPG